MLIASAVRYGPTFIDTGSRNFHTLGVDVMIDESLTPWIIEANQRPDDNSYCTKDTSPFLQGVPVATFARRTLELLGFPNYDRSRYCPALHRVKRFCDVKAGQVSTSSRCKQTDYENLLWYNDMIRSQPEISSLLRRQYGTDEDKTITSLAFEPLVPRLEDREIWNKYAIDIDDDETKDHTPREDSVLLDYLDYLNRGFGSE